MSRKLDEKDSSEEKDLSAGRILVAFEKLFDHDFPARVAENSLLHDILHGFSRFVVIGRYRHSLSGCQTVRLDDGRVAVDRPQALVQFGHHPVSRGHYPRRLHQLLAVRLGPLHRGRGGAGPEAADPEIREGVGDPLDQGGFGAHDDEVRLLVAGRSYDGVDVIGGDIEYPGIRGDPCIARRAEELRRSPGASQGLHDRVLAAAAAEHEHAGW